MTRDEIVTTLQEEYVKLTSLKVMAGGDDDTIILEISKYRGGDNSATGKQADYIFGLPNTSWHSNSCVRQMNKWCASAVIEICKKYPEINFYICK